MPKHEFTLRDWRFSGDAGEDINTASELLNANWTTAISDDLGDIQIEATAPDGTNAIVQQQNKRHQEAESLTRITK